MSHRTHLTIYMSHSTDLTALVYPSIWLITFHLTDYIYIFHCTRLTAPDYLSICLITPVQQSLYLAALVWLHRTIYLFISSHSSNCLYVSQLSSDYTWLSIYMSHHTHLTVSTSRSSRLTTPDYLSICLITPVWLSICLTVPLTTFCSAGSIQAIPAFAVSSHRSPNTH